MAIESTIGFGIMSIKEFAEMIKKPESTVRTWKRRGDIPAECFLTIGTTVFVKTNSIVEFINNAA